MASSRSTGRFPNGGTLLDHLGFFPIGLGQVLMTPIVNRRIPTAGRLSACRLAQPRRSWSKREAGTTIDFPDRVQRLVAFGKTSSTIHSTYTATGERRQGPRALPWPFAHICASFVNGADVDIHRIRKKTLRGHRAIKSGGGRRGVPQPVSEGWPLQAGYSSTRRQASTVASRLFAFYVQAKL
jgi:hypothetical protein